MIIFDYILSNNHNIIQFYNLSGLCELRINKKNIEHKTYDECVQYIRRKLDDHSVTAIKNFNTNMSSSILYNNIIIRNIYRNEIFGCYAEYTVHNVLSMPDNKILFDDKDLMFNILQSFPALYANLSERLKYDSHICGITVRKHKHMFKSLPDKMKNDINFIKSFDDDTIYNIYHYLPHHIQCNKIIDNIIYNCCIRELSAGLGLSYL
jgi:hypothetical protein